MSFAYSSFWRLVSASKGERANRIKIAFMYAITRMRRALNAWCWRVSFRRRGKPYAKQFFDLKHGGSKKALRAAIKWRDAQLGTLDALTLLEFHSQRRSNNVSGVPGVHFHKTRRQPSGFWQASIRFHDGKRMAKTFSVLKFGRRRAFSLAVSARSELLAQLVDRPYLSHAVAKRLIRGKLRRAKGSVERMA